MTHIRNAVRRQSSPGNLAIVTIFMLMMASGIWHSVISQSRWVRDHLLLTPFYDVTVAVSQAADDHLTLRGTMVKRRCEYIGLFGYLYPAKGPATFIWVDTSSESKSRPPGDRPPMATAQYWGPWVIRAPLGVHPARWEIYARHRCPEDDGGTQTNLFARGQWPQPTN